MLDLVIKGGQMVTPQGVGAWDIGVQGADRRRRGAGHARRGRTDDRRQGQDRRARRRRAYAPRAERERRLAQPVSDALRDAGFFRIFRPASRGDGLELDPVTAFRVFEEPLAHR